MPAAVAARPQPQQPLQQHKQHPTQVIKITMEGIKMVKSPGTQVMLTLMGKGEREAHSPLLPFTEVGWSPVAEAVTTHWSIEVAGQVTVRSAEMVGLGRGQGAGI